MNSFRYQAIEGNGSAVSGVIEAEDRKSALQVLGQRGLFPSNLEVAVPQSGITRRIETPARELKESRAPGLPFGKRVSRKDITAFTREMSSLLGASIPIPQALDGLGEEEEKPALKTVVLKISDSVRKGVALSSALEEHPRLFSKLYVSMVRVGEEAGVLPRVMTDLAALLEHETKSAVRSKRRWRIRSLCWDLESSPSRF